MTGEGFGRLAQLAERVSMGVRAAAGLSLLSALVFWGAVFYPFTFARWWGWVLAGLLLVALAVPAAILLFVHIVLRELIGLPVRMRSAGGESRGRLDRAGQHVRERPRWWVPRAAWELWRFVVDNKELLLAYTGIVRLFNPVSAVIVAAAILLSVLLAAAAGLALIVAII